MNSLAMNISFVLYGLGTIATILIGLLYALRSELMPYHLKALETTWEDMDSNYQTLLKGFLNGGGCYGLANGLFMLALLLIPFRNGELWAGYVIGLVGLIGTLPLGYIVYTIKKNTAGNPPFSIMVVVNFLIIAGFIAFILG